jgi:hypothetical protein
MQDQQRRLRSTAVSLGLVGALALSLNACGTSSASATRRCIDANNIRQTDSAYQLVGDENCLVSPGPSTAGGFGTTPSYRHYYGGREVNGYVLGGAFTAAAASRSSSRRWYNPGTWRSSSNSSGTSSASSGSSSTTQSGVSTGGFGSSGSSGGKSGSSSS